MGSSSGRISTRATQVSRDTETGSGKGLLSQGGPESTETDEGLAENILQYLTETMVPKRRGVISKAMAINNKRLGSGQTWLEDQGLIHHTNQGCSAGPS